MGTVTDKIFQNLKNIKFENPLCGFGEIDKILHDYKKELYTGFRPLTILVKFKEPLTILVKLKEPFEFYKKPQIVIES